MAREQRQSSSSGRRPTRLVRSRGYPFWWAFGRRPSPVETLAQELNRGATPATLRLTRGALIAAVYVALVFGFQFASFGPFQLRVAEALTALPLVLPEASLALGIGCLLANILGGLGPWDIFAGSAITLVAALVTRRLRSRPALALASPVVLNALLVSLYLHFILAVPYWPTVFSIGLGEAIVIYLIGWPLLYAWAGRRDRIGRPGLR